MDWETGRHQHADTRSGMGIKAISAEEEPETRIHARYRALSGRRETTRQGNMRDGKLCRPGMRTKEGFDGVQDSDRDNLKEESM